VLQCALSKIQAHAKVVAARRAERLAEAQVRIVEARARAEERELAGSTTSNWVPLAIGLGVIALVSVTGVIVYLYTRRTNDDNTNNGLAGALPMQLAAPTPSVPQIYLVNTGTTGPTERLCAAPQPTSSMQELPISAATQPRPRYHDDPCSNTRR
jgi:hypothetical protein